MPAGWGAIGRDSLAGFGNVPLGRDVAFAVLTTSQGATRVDTVTVFDLVPAERFPLPPTMAMNKQPLMPETVTGSSPNHLRFCAAKPAALDEVSLRCVSHRGHILMERRVRLEPRPLSDVVYEATVKLFVRNPERSDAVVRELVRRPRTLPLVTAMMVSNDGGIWLRRTHDSEPNTVWTRLRPAGTPQDIVTLTPGHRLLRANSDELWTTSTDNDGLQTVHRCTIRTG
jgi:hypothetical protein